MTMIDEAVFISYYKWSKLTMLLEIEISSSKTYFFAHSIKYKIFGTLVFRLFIANIDQSSKAVLIIEFRLKINAVGMLIILKDSKNLTV